MSIHVAASILSLLAYGGLLAVVLLTGWRENRARQLFTLYLLDMVLLQVGFLLVSLAGNPAQALFGYTFMIPVGAAQPLIFFFCIRHMLGWPWPAWLSRAIVGIYLPLVVIATLFSQQITYVNIYYDARAGLFVPEFGFQTLLLFPLFLIFWGQSALDLARAYRATRSFRWQMRIQYLLLSILIIGVGILANVFPLLRPYPIDVAANLLGAGLIAYAMLRYQLLDTRLVIRKGLLYSLSATVLGTGYFLAIYLVLHSFAAPADAQIFYLSLAVAIVAALIVQPFQDRAQQWIDRLFFREEYDGTAMVQKLSRTAAAMLDLTRLTDMILGEVMAVMHLRWAAFFLEEYKDGQFHLLAQRGLPADLDLKISKDGPVAQWLASHETTLNLHDLAEPLAVQTLAGREVEALIGLGTELLIPLRARGELIGILGVGPKRSERTYTQADELILSTLANQTAVAIDNARLYEQTRQDAETRALLLNEVNHRVKNNLSAIVGLLYAERRYARVESQADYLDRMQELISRVHGLAIVHNLLSAANWAELPLSSLASQVITAALQTVSDKAIAVEISMNPVWLDPRQANCLAMVLNELATNSVKYAWGDRPTGRIGLHAERWEKMIRIEYRDDGPGFPAEVLRLERHNLGLYLVQNLIGQELRGQVSLANNGGASTTICFPERLF